MIHRCFTQLKTNSLYTGAILYLSLPLFVFCLFFLRWYYAIICIVALYMIIFLVLRDAKPIGRGYSQKTVLIVFIVSLVWSYLGGMNGLWYQSSDWNARNAIYFDLIQYDWPVMYDQNGGALVYYIGLWLPPAVISKAVVFLTASQNAGLLAGRMLLWIWVSIGLTLVILLLFSALNENTIEQKAFAILLLVFFSGMDLFGAILKGNLESLMQHSLRHPSGPHLEGWMRNMQFSSNTTLLFWVFNQTIIPWIITLLFLLEESPRNYVFYCIACLLSGPFPCVGLTLLMMFKTVMFYAEKRKTFPVVLRNVFSPQNVLSLFVLFLPVASYLLAANAVSGDTPSVGGLEGTSFFSVAYLNRRLCIFILLEVGIYLILILVDQYKNPLYYALWGTFIIFPYFHVGKSIDFCMRATIPALFILMVYLGKFLQDHIKVQEEDKLQGKKPLIQKVCARILIVCLLIGMATPMVEFYRGFYHVIDQKTIFLEDDSLMTLNKEGEMYNFVTADPKEHFFFKYLAR